MGRNAVNLHARGTKKSKTQIKNKGFLSKGAYSLGKKERSSQENEQP